MNNQTDTGTLAFDSSNSGKATINSSTSFLYFFDNMSAFELSFDTNHSYYLETGRIEPQTQTTFTNAAVAGTYLYGRVAPLAADKDNQAGEVSVSSSGALTGLISAAGVGNFSWDESQNVGNLTWLSSTYGTFSIPEGGTDVAACAVISSEKIVCIDGSSSSATMIILQK
jgi:hypothetical protein